MPLSQFKTRVHFKLFVEIYLVWSTKDFNHEFGGPGVVHLMASTLIQNRLPILFKGSAHDRKAIGQKADGRQTR